MRTRKEVEKDGTRTDMLILEVLLDIRGLLNKRECEMLLEKAVDKKPPLYVKSKK